jgi:chitodextrinase
MRFRNAVAVLFSAVLFTSTASAATYYVSTTGNDANPGTQTSPLLTITKGAQMAKAGDTVYVRGGVYNGTVRIGNVGTSSARVVISSYPGETAIIDGTGTAAATDLVGFYQAQYVDLAGFEIRNSTHIGVDVYSSQYVRLLNNNVHHSMRNGIFSGAASVGINHDIIVDGNDVHDNVQENVNDKMGTNGGWASGVNMSGTDNGQMTNNKIHNNWGEGGGAGLANNWLIARNTVYDNFSVNIYLDNAKYVTVDRNFVYNTGNTAYYRSGYPAAGIGTANETWTTQNPLGNLTITNNIVVNCKWDFYYGNYENGGGLHDTVIANNTFYKAAASVLWIDASTHTNTYIENNVFVQVGNVMTSIVGTGVTYRNNLWYGGNAGGAAGAGDVLANPNLANAGGLTPADYKLLVGSPAVAAGVTVSTISNDYFGTARAVAFDIGAHQFGTSTSGGTPAPTLDTTAPSAPGSLTAIAQTSATIGLAWTASTDNVGVTGYNVYRNGALLTSTTATTFTDSGLTASTSYTYTVKAYDGAGNLSASSNSVSTSTLPSGVLPGGGDSIAPTTPTSLVAVTGSASAITLTWRASTDNVGVTGYRVARNGVTVATVTGTSFVDSGLAAATMYTYTVRAIDAAGNQSTASNSASATTSDAKHRTARH